LESGFFLEIVDHPCIFGRAEDDLGGELQNEFQIDVVVGHRDQGKAILPGGDDLEQMVVVPEEIINPDKSVFRSESDDEPGDFRLERKNATDLGRDLHPSAQTVGDGHPRILPQSR
jgi:hypothetical protein